MTEKVQAAVRIAAGTTEMREFDLPEIDTDSARPTGRTHPGSHDCTDGLADPQRPVHDSVELEISPLYQLRLLSTKYLPAGSPSR